MLENYLGIVLKTSSVGESDRLITILTDKKGIIRAFVKRAKSPRNLNSSSTQMLCYSKFSIYMGKTANSVNSAIPIKLFFNLNKDIKKLALAEYFCELALILAPNETNSEELLRLLLNAFHLLANTDKNIYIIKSALELRALSITGYMPDLIGCKKCRKYESDFMYFIPVEGVIYCDNCKSSKIGIKLDLSTISAMRYIIYSEFNKIFSFKLPDDKLKLLSKATQSYVISVTDKNFKSLDFFELIK